MDPLQYGEMLDYSQQNSKLHVSVNQSGNVVMVPSSQDSMEASSSPDSLSQHVTTHIITPEQLEQVREASTAAGVNQDGPGADDLYDALGMIGTDENLADLQPEEDSEEEDERREDERRGGVGLTPDQQKLEFMAAVNLVPPAVLEEIQRRQNICRAEYGNWWDRQHSTDFCLVPKTSNTLNEIASEDVHDTTPSLDGNYTLMIAGEDQTQVAAGPDAESMVEQITYLTSWPSSSSPAHQSNTIEVMTTPTSSGILSGGGGRNSHTHQLQHMGGAGVEDVGYQISFQSINEYNNHHVHH